MNGSTIGFVPNSFYSVLNDIGKAFKELSALSVTVTDLLVKM